MYLVSPSARAVLDGLHGVSRPGPGSSPGVNVEAAAVAAWEGRSSLSTIGDKQPSVLKTMLAVHDLSKRGALAPLRDSDSEAGRDGGGDPVAVARRALGAALVEGTEEHGRLRTLQVRAACGCWGFGAAYACCALG